MTRARPRGGRIAAIWRWLKARNRVAAAVASLVAVSVGLLLLTAPAQASRELLSEAALQTAFCNHCAPVAGEPSLTPPPEGQIEGGCGLAITPGGLIYLSDYYHRVVDVFSGGTGSATAGFQSQIVLPGVDPLFGVNTLDAVCGLAVDPAGRLYANEFHQRVVQLTPEELTIDDGESTGVAVDSSTNRLYVDDRTYLAEYALPVTAGDAPLAKIGVDQAADYYGLAAFEGRLFVADAASDLVKVYEPASPTTAPVATIGGFRSLVNAALGVDPSNGHLLVVDNVQPGFEHPHSRVDEFGAAADGYVPLGPLPGAPIDGGPSGIAVTAFGVVFVTDGNSELANAFSYGPYGSTASVLQSSAGGPADLSAAATVPDAVSVAPQPAAGAGVQGFSPRPQLVRPRRHRVRQHAHRHIRKPRKSR